MKALVVHALSDDLSGVGIVELPAPVRHPGQVLIRVRAAALNHPDLLMTRGSYQLKPPLPFTLGMEMAGQVLEADVDSGYARGDRVVAGTRVGSFADLVVVDARAVRPLPDGIDYARGAAIGAAYLTAHVALVALGGLKPKDWVLVHGATGGVGLAAADLAQALGGRVIATSRSALKLGIVASDVPLHGRLLADDFRESVKTMTNGGANLVFDPVGGDVFDQSTRCIAFGGRLLVVGFTSGRIASLPTNMALIKGFSVHGVRAGEFGRRDPAAGRAAADAVWDLASRGRIRPRIHAIHRLDDWRQAFNDMAAARHVGKLVIEP